jgi:serine/threonine protein phosphatase 1
MEKTFLMADIHGGYRSLMQCFERSKFNYKKDRLIVLGDVCDGWAQTKECIEELLKVKNIIYILGNHDFWALDYYKTGKKEYLWVTQGGYNTIKSYGEEGMPTSHIEFLENAKYYYEEDGILFVHGGIIPNIPIKNITKEHLMWDRDLIFNAHKKSNGRPNYRMQDIYNEIFVGHTSTGMFRTYLPLKCCEVTDLDTGGGWDGVLTIMNLKTREYWYSDYVHTLYPESYGREDYNKNGTFHEHP